MQKQTNIGHSTELQTIGQIREDISGSEICFIDKVATEISGILDDETQDYLLNSHNRFSELLGNLQIEINKVKDTLTINYDTDYYKEKLLIDNATLELTFKKLLEENTELNKVYSDLILFLGQFPNGDLIIKEIHKLYLENLVYDYIDIMSELSDNTNTKEINNLEDVYAFLNEKILPGSTYLDIAMELNKNSLLTDHSINYITLFEIIKFIGKSGIKSLDIGFNNLYVLFKGKPDLLTSFIEVAGQSGIKCIDLTGNTLEELCFWNKDLFIQPYVAAYNSGLEQIIFGDTFIQSIFRRYPEDYLEAMLYISKFGIKDIALDTELIHIIFKDKPIEDFLNFINIITTNGIKNLSFNGAFLIDFLMINGLENILKLANIFSKNGVISLELINNQLYLLINRNRQLLLDFIKILGQNGVEYFNLSRNQLGLSKSFDFDYLVQIINTAGQSGLAYLNLENNGLNEICSSGSTVLIDLLDVIGNSGLKKVSLIYNLFMSGIDEDSQEYRDICNKIDFLKENNGVTIILKNEE